MSDCPIRVGRPVEGLPLCMFTRTQGASIMTASPMFSCIREKPGPDVAVMALAPAREAPTRAAMLPNSSSIWTKMAPTAGRRFDSLSAISVEGVIG